MAEVDKEEKKDEPQLSEKEKQKRDSILNELYNDMSSSDEEDDDQAPDVDLSKPLEDTGNDIKLAKSKSAGAAAAASSSPKQATQTS